MHGKSGCVKWGAILFLMTSIVAFLAGSAFILFDYLSRQNTKARAQYTPPVVQVTDPVSNALAATGSYLTVAATAMGMQPIVRVELWLDGQSVDTQNSEKTEGLSPFYANFAVLIPSDGPHTLFVRAVNKNGLIGQSSPISLTGEPKPANPLLAVTTQEGQTLKEIASTYGSSPEVLQGLNPGVGNKPPTGSTIKVPAPPEQQGPAGPSGPPPPPAPGNTPFDIPDVQMLTISDMRLVNPFRFPFGVPLPAAPTGLQAEFKDCKVILRWNDNALDEEKYDIYVASSEDNYKQALLLTSLKPSPKTGPAWYAFETGELGAISVWVEAVNSGGAQPSNIVWVFVPFVSGCSSTLWQGQYLDVTLMDITVSGNYDKAYCYISIENQPEQWLPSANQYIQLVGGKGQGFQTTFSLQHLPSDDVLDLSGKCLGWAGNTLNELGPFSGKFPVENWDGKRRVLKGPSYEIGLSLKARAHWGLGWAEGFGATDPTLPVPYEVHEDSPDDPNVGPHTRRLSWKWDGNLDQIDAFQIFLNGQPYPTWSLDAFYYRSHPLDTSVEQLHDCGASISWQVAVKKGTTLSALSAPWKYNLPDCQKWLSVKFDGIHLIGTDDGWPSGGAAVFACETLDAYFWFSVEGVHRSFYGGNMFLPLKCGDYSFAQLIGDFYNPAYAPHPDLILFPLSDSNLLPKGGNMASILVRAEFMDHDDGSDDDVIGSFTEYIYPPAPQKDGRWSECVYGRTTPDHVTGEATSHISFTYSFYPNKCADTPPELKDYYRHP